jgi:hypothetical protein
MFRPFALVAALSFVTPAMAQPDLMVVLDGSGSMWGQIDGRAKIELAREGLSSVLSEAGQDMQIGLMAYGHRQRGQCGDIETLVPMGPAAGNVQTILDRAYALKPKGMTPLTDAVMAAAEQLGYTERAATIVLLTDGIENCGGDPCALGRMLAEQGIDFTAHVVGFDMTDAEQRTVACLADETGGLFLAADDGAGLGQALRDTILSDLTGPVVAVITPPVPDPDPAPQPRVVEIILRDAAGGPVLTASALQSVTFAPLDEDGATPAAVALRVGDKPWTVDGDFLPGRYEIRIDRAGPRGAPIRAALVFEVPEGRDPYRVDLVIAARLGLTGYAHTGLPMPASGNLPFATYGSGAGRAQFTIHPIIGGAIDPSIDYGGWNIVDVALPPGDYFIRGELAQTFAREKLVHVPPGETLALDFDFAASRVVVSFTDAAGTQLPRQVASFHDAGRDAWFATGGGGDGLPFYLPQGRWRIEARNDQNPQRGSAIVTVPGGGQDVRITLRDGDSVAGSDLPDQSCLAYGPQGRVCYVETVSPYRIAQELPNAAFGGDALMPRFTGTWDIETAMMVLVQDGRRVWGEWHQGRDIRPIYGEIGPDGRTMRGTIMQVGIVELQLSPDGLSLRGGSSHFGGGDTGTRVAPELTNNRYHARKLSAAPPPLQIATGTEADLHPAFRNGAVPAFEAFMQPVRMVARPDIEGDLDQMQMAAEPVTFGGGWNSQHGFLQFQQHDRRIWGERDAGVMEGEISADGTLLRGSWTNNNGRWGLFEFALADDMDTFTGKWGYELDQSLSAGTWSGTRGSFLAAEPQRASRDGTRHPGAQGADFDAFMEPVRDAEIVPCCARWIEPVTDSNDFTPQRRYDFAHADGRPAVSFVFGQDRDGGAYTPGFALLHPFWCGSAACTGAEVFPLGGATPDEVPNPLDRLVKGGVFPALDLSSAGIIAFQGDDSGADLAVYVHVLADPYLDIRQLGAANAQVRQSFGPFTGGVAQVAQMADFVNGAGPVLGPPPVAVEIGTITPLPTGIFAAIDLAPGQTPQETLAPMVTAVMADQIQARCSTSPTAIHDDGLIAERSVLMGQGARIDRTFATTAYRRCTQNGPILTCEDHAAPLTPAPRRPEAEFTAEIILGPDGSFTMATLNGPVPSRTYYNCVGAQDLAGSTQLQEDGRIRRAHIMDREDQMAQLSPPEVINLLDFANLQGLWGDMSSGDNSLFCDLSPIVIRDDGHIAIWGGNPQGDTAIIGRLACDALGDCNVTSATAAASQMPPNLTLAANGAMLDLCAGGGCRTLGVCAASVTRLGTAAELLAAMDGPTPAPPQGETPATRLPAGIWLPDHGGDGGIIPGSAAHLQACYETPSIVDAAGMVTGLDLREEAAGPAYSVVYSEICTASGNASWPLNCALEDANVADPSAAQMVVPTQLYARPDGTFRQVGDFQGYVDETRWLNCDTVLDLNRDPLGPVLAKTIADFGGQPAPTPAPAPAPTPDPVQQGQLTPPADMRLSLAGLWFPRIDGRPLADYSAAEQAEACLTRPGFMHPDGLFVAYETAPGDYIPRANAHLRCAPDMSCDFFTGGPGQGQPTGKTGYLIPVAGGDGQICIDSTCIGLSRCADPVFSDKDRDIGLDREWQARVTARN